MTKIEQAIACILSTSLSDFHKKQALLLVCTQEQIQQKPAHKNPPQETFVYLIANAEGHTKIGFSGNPEKRLQQLKTACPSAKLLCKFVGTLQDEKHLHSMFHHRRFANEWFDLSQNDFCHIHNYFNDRKNLLETSSASMAISALEPFIFY